MNKPTLILTYIYIYIVNILIGHILNHRYNTCKPKSLVNHIIFPLNIVISTLYI